MLEAEQRAWEQHAWDESLIEAARAGNLVDTKEALAKGSRINAQCENGKTPLHFAAQYGYTEIVRLLLVHGADPTIKWTWKQTPLEVATKFYKLYGPEHDMRETIELLKSPEGGAKSQSN